MFVYPQHDLPVLSVHQLELVKTTLPSPHFDNTDIKTRGMKCQGLKRIIRQRLLAKVLSFDSFELGRPRRRLFLVAPTFMVGIGGG